MYLYTKYLGKHTHKYTITQCGSSGEQKPEGGHKHGLQHGAAKHANGPILDSLTRLAGASLRAAYYVCTYLRVNEGSAFVSAHGWCSTSKWSITYPGYGNLRRSEKRNTSGGILGEGGRGPHTFHRACARV